MSLVDAEEKLTGDQNKWYVLTLDGYRHFITAGYILPSANVLESWDFAEHYNDIRTELALERVNILPHENTFRDLVDWCWDNDVAMAVPNSSLSTALIEKKNSFKFKMRWADSI
jgi:hypothetical protein